MSNEKKSTSYGLGLGTIVFLIFLVLKLAGIGMVATWSWWWVTAPLWIPFAIGGVIMTVLFALGLIASLIK